MSQRTPKPRPGGRTARTRRAVIEAAIVLLSERGLSDVTIGDVAARSGVHETTIYRRWRNKDALISDVLLTLSEETLPAPDTGSLRGDLVAVVEGVAAFLRTPPGYALTYLNAASNGTTAGQARDAFWADRFAKAQGIFDRAVERGEIVDAAVAELAYEALIGTMHFRILGRRRELDPDIAHRLVDLVLDGVDAIPPSGD
ncbi:TetR/AcrR family transcriptional regulator [Tsukamurella sp. 8F]|uniref:TetR/AcrR family transcriptional regulator n=1 Tax=unclassified Tsukamurella TaxID=2633480 RepID=UPI0023B968C9|nr:MULTISPECIES: TetR/AcrR family transcriptional regulator [unclassified Tsukamurella]MDF0528661.1 TetR/AcrR family transcriptional regulator [Tsukamurella sp. 8J]MDF0585623.1 TetR/AcrR family transcriptional regulator [Tsukamurella sp. 8F]